MDRDEREEYKVGEGRGAASFIAEICYHFTPLVCQNKPN